MEQDRIFKNIKLCYLVSHEDIKTETILNG